MALSALAQTSVGDLEAPKADVAKACPRIHFATNEIDLGRVAGGSVARCILTFTNTGSQTLEIKDVRPGCGCTTAGQWTRSVAPGASGQIPLQLEAPNVDSTFVKMVAISCNDPVEPRFNLRLSGVFWVAVDIQPPIFSFNFADAGDTKTIKSVRLKSRLNEPLQLSPPLLNHTNFQAELKTIETGKEFELTVRSLARPALGAAFATPVKIKTSSGELPVINVNVVALVPPPIEVKPPRMVILGPPAAPQSVTIRNHLESPLKLWSPEVSIPGVQVQLDETEPGQVFRLGLIFPSGMKLASGQTEKVTVATDDPEHPRIEIPIVIRDLAPQRVRGGRVLPPRRYAPPTGIARDEQSSSQNAPAAAVDISRAGSREQSAPP